MQRLKRSPRRAVSKLGPNVSTEDRLTHASLLLGYLFEDGVDFQRRAIRLTGDVDTEMFEKLDAAMTEMEAESKKAITIKIDSYGGDVYQAMAIVGRIRESKCQIVTKGYGPIMSAATLILAAGDKRYVSRHSWLMHHEASYETGGRHSEIKALVIQSDREERQWSEWMAEFSNQSAEFWLKTGTNTDAYFSAEQLLKYGVIDGIF